MRNLLDSIRFVFLFTCIAVFLYSSNLAAQSLPGTSSTQLKEPTAINAQIKPLNKEQIDALLSGLTDMQARELLRSQLIAIGTDSPSNNTKNLPSTLVTILNEKPAQIQRAFIHWIKLANETPDRISRGINLATKGQGVESFYILLIAIIAIIFVGHGIDYAVRRFFLKYRLQISDDPVHSIASKSGRMLIISVFDLIALAALAATVLILFKLFIDNDLVTKGQEISQNILFTVVGVHLVGIASRFFLAPKMPNLRICYISDQAASFARNWIQQMAWMLGIMVIVQGLITSLGIAGQGFRPFIDSFLGSVFLAVIISGIWRRRTQIADWIKTGSSTDLDWRPSVVRNQFAENWHILATIYVVFVFSWWLVGALTQVKISPIAVLVSLSVIPIVPILDSAAKHAINALVSAKKLKSKNQKSLIIGPETDFDDGEELDHSSNDEPFEEKNEDHHKHEDDGAYHPLAHVGHRIFRVALVIGTILIMFDVWGLDAFSGIQSQIGESASQVTLELITALAIGYVIWEFINAFTKPYMPSESLDLDMDEGGGKAANRLETLMPLLRTALMTALAITVIMISLSALGVNIGPLLAGAGVAGIAIGFGAQKLVADVLSGIFFLIDDAFRVGEYVDTGQVKGTVEKITVRSLQLRHHRGALHTIPFGEIRHLTNYHRDWAIVKMEFRVPYDTDVEKVRKLIKKQGQEMLLDERFSETMLAPLKSQGVARMEDSAMIIRAKFTAVPGEQFVMRREAYRRIQQTLQNNGIEFAHRKVTVEFPDREVEMELGEDEKIALGAGADEAASSAGQSVGVKNDDR